MVASQSRYFVYRTRLLPSKPQIVFGAGNKKRARCGDPVEASEVGLTFVEKVNGSRLEHQCVQPVHIVQTGWGNKDTNRHRSPQIDLRVNLDRALGRAESRPWKQGHRQIDRA